MKEPRELIVHTPATVDKARQLARVLKTVQKWQTWYYTGNEDKKWEFQGAGDIDHPEKTDRICKISPQSLDLLKRMGMVLYDDLCSMGAEAKARAVLMKFRKDG